MSKISYSLLFTFLLLYSLLAKSSLIMQNIFEDDDNCVVYTVDFHEGFNTTSTTEACWTVVDLDPSGTVSNLTWNLNSTWPVIEGNQSAKLQGYWNTATSNDWLISPQVTVSGNQQVRFKYVGRSSPDADSNFKVFISTNGSINPNDFIEIETIDLITPSGSPTISVEKIIPLTGYTGNIRIAFTVPFDPLWLCDNNNYCMWPWELNIDDFHIEDIPSCSVPTSLTIADVTNTSAQISWVAGNQETQWEVVVVPASSTINDIDIADLQIVNTPEYLVENLEESTQYKFYVRAFCSESSQSDWIESELFYSDSCSVENKCIYKIRTKATSNGGAFGYKLQVWQEGILIEEFIPNAFENFFEIALCKDVPLSFTWSSNNWQEYITDVYIYDPLQEIVHEWHQIEGVAPIPFFETLTGFDCEPITTCYIPQNVEIVNINQTTVELEWEEMGTATMWEVLVLPQGDPIPNIPTTIVVANTNPFVVSNLESGTSYSFYVRAVCTETDKSNWSFEVQGNTLIENDDCIGAIQLLVSQNFYCENPRRATLTTANQSPEPVSCGGAIPNDDVWFKFIATSTSHVIYINNVSGVSNNISVGNDISMNKVLYTGSCDNLQQVFCQEGNTWPLNNQINGNIQNADNDMLIENLVIGQEYYLRVYSNFSTVNKIDFSICITIPEKPLFVSDDQYTPKELVTEVLMGGSCSAISNFSYKTGITYGAEHNGLGYFEKRESSFPFENGILLSTGKSNRATGHKTSINSYTYVVGNEIAWPGDQQLFDYAQNLGFDSELENYYNATVIEFDFVGSDDAMSFEFLFASEDYGKFQCEWSDAFAFFLTDASGNTQNLALLPANNTPISVTTVRDEKYNYPNMASCLSDNSQYFSYLSDGYKGRSRYSSNNNFMGNTVPLVAQSTIVPGETYHIKLVIADRNDGNFDSAVFIKGGSFNFNPLLDLGEDKTVEENNAICQGEMYLIQSPIVGAGYIYQWSKDGEIILNENSSSLQVYETGDYSLRITLPGGICHIEDTISVEFYDDFRVLLQAPQDYEFCYDSYFEIDLTEQEGYLIQNLTGSFSFSYFTSEFDAQNNNNNISDPTSFEFMNSQTIYIKITSDKGCSTILSFNIIIYDSINITEFDDIEACSFFTLPSLSENEKYFTASRGNGDELVPGRKLSIGNYTVYVYNKIGDCFAESSFDITVEDCNIPKGISPNGDGKNDRLDLTKFNVRSIKIYNRYGKEVYSHGVGYTDQWYGEDTNGKLLPSGTYFYKIDTIEESFSGWIQLIREIN